jgi:hypothetical protein
MSTRIFKAKHLLLLFLVTAMLGGCAVYEPLPAGSYVVNADGTRTYVQGVYTCPAGYTCTYPAATGTATTYAPAPVYYNYPPTYVGPSPYIWPPLFFGMGYYWGGGYHHHHHPRR